MKTCKTCKKTKDDLRFKSVKRGKVSYRNECSACISARHRQKVKGPVEVDIDVSDFESDVDFLNRQLREHTAQSEESSMKRHNRLLIAENERLRESLNVMNNLPAPSPISMHAKAATKSDAEVFMVASDWHVEEDVPRDSVHGLNQYDPDIAKYRAEKFFVNGLKLANMIARDCDVTTLNLGMIGDLFSGNIHEDLAESNHLGPASAAQFAQDLLTGGIQFLLENSDLNLRLIFMDGNHGRMTRQMRVQTRGDNSLELFMMRQIAKYFADEPRIESVLPSSELLYTNHFENFKIRWTHGDSIRYAGGIGGLTIPLIKAVRNWDKAQPANLTVLGHFHQLFNGGEFICNGSLIGYNAFAQYIRASPEAPRQAFFSVNARNGGELGVFAPIWLDDAT